MQYTEAQKRKAVHRDGSALFHELPRSPPLVHACCMCLLRGGGVGWIIIIKKIAAELKLLDI